jgi:hypothetical protein
MDEKDIANREKREDLLAASGAAALIQWGWFVQPMKAGTAGR